MPEQRNSLIGGKFPSDMAMYSIEKVRELVTIANKAIEERDMLIEALKKITHVMNWPVAVKIAKEALSTIKDE